MQPTLIILLLFFPFVLGALALRLERDVMQKITIASVIGMAFISLLLWQGYSQPIRFDLPLDSLFIVADYALLGYFVWQGKKHQNFLVSILAIIQIVFFTYFLSIKPHEELANLRIDELSLFMYFLISIVGGIICIYAFQYISDEECEEDKRKYFIALLLAFLGVMNFIVSVDDIDWFFLFFEMTTLASYLLIRFRMDEVSLGNALRALWMNQIGGVAILFALIGLAKVHGSIHFSTLVEANALVVMLPVAFIAVAAMIKGAQMPFDKWLLGAMVAPTPVSAILHSATMVKIAPYTIIKISPVLAGTVVAKVVILLGGFVFVAAALIALSREHLKQILAYSTISLLGLMILLGAVGSAYAITAALMLMLFHGIAKAMLFMEAGVLEKRFHVKYLQQMQQLVEKAPLSTFLIVLGFISITLPPFGAFLGKWLALETVSFHSLSSMGLVLSLLLIIIGSVVLTLLYFRVVGMMLIKDGGKIKFEIENLPGGYKYTNLALGIMLVVTAILIAPLGEGFFAVIASGISHTPATIRAEGLTLVLGFTSLPFYYIAAALIFMLLPIFFYFVHFSGPDRVKEYACGERMEIGHSSYYFDFVEKYGDKMNTIGILLFVMTIFLGGAA